ncbi:MAG: hypothetical protein WCK60_03085 [Candidatus Nomurabacteria bacterium]
MAIPNIDTFEQDIRDEIKHKEATVGDIASASGSVSNSSSKNNYSSPNQKSSRSFYISASIIFVLVLGGFSYLYYLYTNQQPTAKEAVPSIINNQTNIENTTEMISKKLSNFSPTLSVGISRFTSKVENTPYGITLSINNYGSTFAFMIKNETEIAKEVLAVELKNYENSTTTPDLTFTDVTKSNQNMREVTVGSSTLVYAFINDQYLAFASSTENILKMRGTIIK